MADIIRTIKRLTVKDTDIEAGIQLSVDVSPITIVGGRMIPISTSIDSVTYDLEVLYILTGQLQDVGVIIFTNKISDGEDIIGEVLQGFSTDDIAAIDIHVRDVTNGRVVTNVAIFMAEVN